jgi:transposase
MKKIREVLRLKYDRGATTRQIAQSCKLSVSTVSEYLYRASAAGYVWPLTDALTDEDLERSLFPPRPKSGEPARPLPDWPMVRTELSRKGVTLLLLWREYKREHPDGYGYSRFAGMYSEWEKRSQLSMLQRHKAGEKLFVDYAGLTVRIADPETGEVTAAQIFVAAMGASQKIFAKACASQDVRSWIQAHVSAFEFYGALPEVLVPDNLKSGVTSPCYYEPTINAAYAELARFYEVAVLPARVRKPKDKAKVENAVQQVERWVLAPLRDRTFFSLSELNEVLAGLIEDLNSRVMKGPGCSRNEMFATQDLPAMRPLPAIRYSYAQWGSAKVAPDYHIEFEGHKYSVPYELVGKRVELRVGANVVEIYSGSVKVASHMRSLSRFGFTTIESHMPESHQAAKWTPERLESWALKIGPQARILVRRILEAKDYKEHGFRTVLGVLRLEKKYGKDRLERACAKANAIGAMHYSNVKSILEKNLEGAATQPQLPGLPAHENVRGASYYYHQEEIDA